MFQLKAFYILKKRKKCTSKYVFKTPLQLLNKSYIALSIGVVMGEGCAGAPPIIGILLSRGGKIVGCCPPNNLFQKLNPPNIF